MMMGKFAEKLLEDKSQIKMYLKFAREFQKGSYGIKIWLKMKFGPS